MNELYFWSEPARVLLNLLLVTAFVLQGVLLTLAFLQRRSDPKRLLRAGHECVIQLHLLMLALLFAEVELNLAEYFIAPPGFIVSRYVLSAVLLIDTLLALIFLGKPWRLADTLVLLTASPPVIPLWRGRSWIAMIVIALYFAARAVVLIARLRARMRSGFSGLSIKSAFDNLPTGLLFYETDGRILNMNREMRRIAVALFGQSPKNGLDFHAAIGRGRCLAPCVIKSLGDRFLVFLDDGEVRRIDSHRIGEGRNIVWQMTATDVTLQQKRRHELTERVEALQQRQTELLRTLRDIERISRDNASIRLKRRFHDALGQRIALMLRSLQEGRVPDDELIAAFADGLPSDVYANVPEKEPAELFRDLVSLYRDISVTLTRTGDWPADTALAHFFVMIVREAATNAIRHGLADRVDVCLREDDDNFYMTVTNNGAPGDKPPREGNGIREMRAALAEFGGILEVKRSDVFELSVRVPKHL